MSPGARVRLDAAFIAVKFHRVWMIISTATTTTPANSFRWVPGAGSPTRVLHARMDSRGIQPGTAISRGSSTPNRRPKPRPPSLLYRDLLGRSRASKRQALLAGLPAAEPPAGPVDADARPRHADAREPISWLTAGVRSWLRVLTHSGTNYASQRPGFCSSFVFSPEAPIDADQDTSMWTPLEDYFGSQRLQCSEARRCHKLQRLERPVLLRGESPVSKRSPSPITFFRGFVVTCETFPL